MDDPPSNWEWPWKLLAVVLFVIVMAAVYWFANNLFREWLPTQAVLIITPAFMAFAAGYLLGQRSMALHVKKLWGKDPREGG
jgi:hypothetical protein